MEPLTSGHYPDSMRSLVSKRLPKFNKEQSTSLAGSFDFIGINYYTARYAASAGGMNEYQSYLTDSRTNILSEYLNILGYLSFLELLDSLCQEKRIIRF